MKNINKAFTLVELIVVITILIILSTVGIMSYDSQVGSAKNTTRTTDLGNLLISLKNHKLKTGVYPLPGDYFNIVNSGSSNVVAYQGFMNDKVYSTELQTKPTDPDYKIPYFYSVNSNKNYYQLRATLIAEDDTQKDKAYLVGDYATVSKDILPTLILAISTGATNNVEIASGTTQGNINRLKFIVNNGTMNLPYNSDQKTPISTATSFSSIFSESQISYPQYPGYSSCLEIYEAGRSIGSGSYQILSNTGAVTNTGCSMSLYCPSGFIYIPGSENIDSQTKGWCVAKYEMTPYNTAGWTQDATYLGWKCTSLTDSNINPCPGMVTSKLGINPVTYISRNEAQNACATQLVDSSGSAISNGKLLTLGLWKIIADNLVNQGSNWTSGIPGTGNMS
ncbi:MAG: prepilin-type N-terminal cleavage/methylation domain-containing protein, partial [Candidatus Gracilibacteria bacterium]|nr:prepilin-type N-terminal cleavage/methylation domain-containing protein [Candidatus Gracilibacteria bacterium]